MTNDTTPSSTEPQAPEVAQPGESQTATVSATPPPASSPATTSATDTTAATAVVESSSSTDTAGASGIDPAKPYEPAPVTHESLLAELMTAVKRDARGISHHIEALIEKAEQHFGL